MKTPREILLGRHRGAEPQLDQIRRRAVTAVSSPQGQRPVLWARLSRSCREFFRIPRLAWAGLGAAWTLIIALNVASSETQPGPDTLAAAARPRHSQEMLQALREQKRFFTELVGAASEAAEAEAPRFVPRPRSERTPQTGMA